MLTLPGSLACQSFSLLQKGPGGQELEGSWAGRAGFGCQVLNNFSRRLRWTTKQRFTGLCLGLECVWAKDMRKQIFREKAEAQGEGTKERDGAHWQN